MNGETKKNFVLAFASFAIGAAVAGVLGNSKAREKLAEVGKKVLEREM